MIGKKLSKILSVLTPTEFRRMRKLFQSPIYTSNPHHLKLYDYLKKYYPDFDSPKLEKEVVFKKVYGRQAFDDWKLRSLVTEFTRLTEAYLIMLDNRQNDFQCKKQLTKIYAERNLYDFFEKGTKDLLADLEASPYRDMDYYLNRAQLNEVWYFHPMKNKYDLKDNSLEDLMESIDRYFVLAKMRFGIAMKNVERILAKQYELQFLEVFEKERIFDKEVILFKLYQCSFKLLTEQKDVYFEEIEKLFFENIKLLNANDCQLIFFNALNYASQQINKGKIEFNKKVFFWNQFGLENELFFYENKISEVVFGNVVMIGCKTAEFNWTRNFIETYQIYLEGGKKESIVTFNLGIWNYYQGNYNETLSILSNFPFSKSYIFRARLIIIECLFELFLKDKAYFEVLLSNIQSFETFISRDHFFSKTKLKPHLNFVKILKKIVKMFLENNTKKTISDWFEIQLATSDEIGRKDWLIEKLKSD